MISIGRIEGGPEVDLTRVAKMLSQLANICTQLRFDPLRLSVVFTLPGSMYSQPGFVGLRLGKFVKKDKLLFVHIAVPSEVLRSENELIVSTFLLDSLKSAGVIASDFLRKKGIEFSDQVYSNLLASVAKAIHVKPSRGISGDTHNR